MGLYNRIIVKEPPICPMPNCGKPMRAETESGEWQSKDMAVDGVDQELYMETYPIEKISSGEMHGLCEHCETFVELRIENGKVVGGEPR